MPFQGTDYLTLDAKHRLTVPSRHRANFGEEVVLARGLETCLALWRPEDYEIWVASALAGHSPLSRQYGQLQRFFNANSFRIRLDAAGRVQLPPVLLAKARLEREVALVGAGESLEVWDRPAWDAYDGDVLENVLDIADRFNKPPPA